MKSNIHPKVYSDTKITCTCGNTFTLSTTAQELRIEVCNKCHPFFTGEMKYVDTLGRVERFQEKQKKAKELKAKKVEKTEQRKQKERPDSLKDMFELVKKQVSS